MKRLALLGLALLVALPCGRAEEDRPAVTKGELVALKARFAKVKAREDLWRKEIEKELKDAEALKIEKMRVESRPRLLAYLRCVMMLEEDLELLATPVDKIEEVRTPELSAPERRRVAELRQKIRDRERARIQDELKNGRSTRSDEKAERAICRDEERLDALYGRKVAKLERDISKAERNLEKEQVSRRRDGNKVETLEVNLEKWREDRRRIHTFIYGVRATFGFELRAGDWGGVGNLPAELSAERDRVIMTLRGGAEEGGEDARKGGLVGGSYLRSANLGVVLDVSGSMSSHIEKLKKEIAATFERPRYREVNGCRISGNTLGQFERSGRALPGPDTVGVVEELIVVHRVDTVYWFCDLRDAVDYAGLRRLRFLLMRGETAFHVKSVANRPDRSLKPLITDFQN